MVDVKSYVPILKWKSAEQRALRGLNKENKEKMVPLIELVMPKISSQYKDKKAKIKKSPEEIFAEVVLKFEEKRTLEIPNEINNSWGKLPIFLDFSLLYGYNSTNFKIDSMKKIFPVGESLGLNLIPVVNLNDEEEIKKEVAILSKVRRGLCLRITSSNLDDTQLLNEKIKNFLSAYSLKENDIDLLIDIKSIDSDDIIYQKYVNKSQSIESLEKWRSLVFASGAFPVDFSECKFGEPEFLPKLDWQNWLNYIYNKPLKRRMTFADYTMRNPIFKESTQFYSPTTTISYCMDKDWIVMKGKKLRFDLYLANAKLLVDDSGYFYGKDFSSGDQFIYEKACHYEKYMKNPKIKGTGGSEDWIYACINHHLVLTRNLISNLP